MLKRSELITILFSIYFSPSGINMDSIVVEGYTVDGHRQGIIKADTLDEMIEKLYDKTKSVRYTITISKTL